MVHKVKVCLLALYVMVIPYLELTLHHTLLTHEGMLSLSSLSKRKLEDRY